MSALVLSTNRTWSDANGNYVPDCDLHNKGANGECGAMDNQSFGTTVRGTQYTDELKNGWNVSPNLWQGQISVQQQVMPNVGLSVGYFRTSYGNIYVTDNLAVTPADFDSFCITAPADRRLPGGGGTRCATGCIMCNARDSVRSTIS